MTLRICLLMIFYLLFQSVKAQDKSAKLLDTQQEAQKFLKGLYEVLAVSDTSGIKAFFLTETEADSIASMYRQLMEVTSEEAISIKPLFLNRTQTAKKFLENNFGGELRQFMLTNAEEQRNARLHFFRIRTSAITGDGPHDLELGIIEINGLLKVVHATYWNG